VKKLRSNLLVLVAEKSQRDGKRITLRSVARDTQVSTYTIYALANNELNEYPKEVLETLCNYFECQIGDLLVMRDIPDETPTA
jgi:putative transcriptional regulator